MLEIFGFLKFVVSGLIAPLAGLGQTWLKGKNDIGLVKANNEIAFDTSLLNAQLQLALAKVDLLKNRWLVGVQVGFSLPLMFYYGKVHTWDAALHLGSTDAIRGDVATWDMWVMAFLFAHAVFLGRR